MKKMFVVFVLVTLMVSCFAAQAELCYTGARTEKFSAGVGKHGEEIVTNYYYVTVTSDLGSVELEVTAEEYESVDSMLKQQAKREADALRPWYQNAVARVTFWNPED